MEKDFDRWNTQKKSINQHAQRLYFREGEIWWAHLGVNVGYETGGKRADFSRPVLILKKYNQFSFLTVPLTTNDRPNPYHLFIGMVDGKRSFAALSQIRNLDSLRLINKVSNLDASVLAEIRKAVSKANLS